MIKLCDLKENQTAKIVNVGGSGALRQHFLDMGIIPNTYIKLNKFAPLGDPIEFTIHGYELSLRLADAEKIDVIEIDENIISCENEDVQSLKIDNNHPGLGEDGKYHDKKNENIISSDLKLDFALVGNQNCGKTTLFNQLTGSNQHVGNFPGVTVDSKIGQLRGIDNANITDLPGIYSLSPYTSEEIVSREYILNNRPSCIINILDANNLERNLYLSLQLLELEIPVVLALNMMDELRGNGGSININTLENLIGVPVVPITASKNEGVDELIAHALHIATYQEKPIVTDFCEENSPIHRCIHGIMSLIDDHAKASNIPLRFAATKLVEGDKLVSDALNLSQNEKEMVEHIVLQMEDESGLDRSAAIAEMRFNFIKKITGICLKKPKESKEHQRSKKIDKVLTGKYTAIPCFILIMSLVFWLTFDVLGSRLQEMLDRLIQQFTILVDNLLLSSGVAPIVRSLVIDGIFAGVGGVLSFLPIIVILFFFLSMLEDSGYMARIAFVTDKLLRKLGLSGRSIVPMLIGFGCSVPAVMSSRTLPSARDRKMTILMIPFMSCSAKIPIYAFFVNAFFKDYKAVVMICLYLLSICIGIIVLLITKNTIFKGDAVPFVMELPNYRLPGFKNTLMLLWEKARDFLTKAFTLIFVASIIIWFLESLDFRFNLVNDQSLSMLAIICGFIAPIFKPLGFGSWQAVTSIITGILAKESVVGTLEVLYKGENIALFFSSDVAIAMLVFCLLYTPCVAALAAIKRELGFKWAISISIFQFCLAWILAYVIRLLALIVI